MRNESTWKTKKKKLKKLPKTWISALRIAPKYMYILVTPRRNIIIIHSRLEFLPRASTITHLFLSDAKPKLFNYSNYIIQLEKSLVIFYLSAIFNFIWDEKKWLKCTYNVSCSNIHQTTSLYIIWIELIFRLQYE